MSLASSLTHNTCAYLPNKKNDLSLFHEKRFPVSYSCLVTTVPNVNLKSKFVERKEFRLGLPSKGRMPTDTLDLLKDCQLSVRQVNPRQYVAEIPQDWQLSDRQLILRKYVDEIPQFTTLKASFQRPKDVVRKLMSGDLDLEIVGYDIVQEYRQEYEDLILVHEALVYGDFRLSLAIPKYVIFENIKSLKELAEMPHWTAERPLRVATGFTYLGPKFMKDNGLKHVTFSTADGALEAAPAMGIADAIVDLVSSGTALKENNLKEIDGGVIGESQAVLGTSRRSLIQLKDVLDVLDVSHEMLERLEAHLKAMGQFTVTVNTWGSSEDEVIERVLNHTSLSGLQGPTVFRKRDEKVMADYYAIVICVPKKALYSSVQQLKAIGGRSVLISPLTYVFDEETPRLSQLLYELGSLRFTVAKQLKIKSNHNPELETGNFGIIIDDLFALQLKLISYFSKQ